MVKTRTIPLAKVSGHDLLARTADFPGSTQIRAINDAALVESYARLMADGTQFPPVLLIDDSSGSFLLADGHHRVEAKWIVHALDPKRFSPTIEAEVRPGNFSDAIRLAIEANRTHGKSLTEADHHHAFNRAVATGVLETPHDWRLAQALLGCSARTAQRVTAHKRAEYIVQRNALIIALSEAGESQRAIAAKVGVSQNTVTKTLAERSPPLAETGHDDETTEDAPPPPNPRKDAERWRAATAAARQTFATRLQPSPDDAIPEPVEGTFPLPALPPVAFKRPQADADAPDLVAEALQQIDALADVADVQRWLTEADAETTAAIEERVARSLQWLTEFQRIWQKQERAA
jgi:Homeodomain-like domain-containing protein